MGGLVLAWRLLRVPVVGSPALAPAFVAAAVRRHPALALCPPADNETAQNTPGNGLHAAFQLSSSGETIGLYNTLGVAQHTLAFGRLFFLTAYIVFEVEKKGNAKIGLGEILRNARTSESEKAVLSVFIGICIFLLLATGVYKVWNHRRSRTFDRAETSVAIGDYGSLNQPNQTHQEEIPS